MTVETDISQSGPYAGAGTVGPFTVGFRFLDATHLRVIRTDNLGEHVLVLNTDYTVLGVGDPTGSVTLLAVLPVGQTLTIVRKVPQTQETNYVQNDDFPAESHENALDKLTMIDQQQQNTLERSITTPVSDSQGLNKELPVAALRAMKALVFNADGSVGVSVDNYNDQAAAAAASAAAAAASATSASGSATSAAASATSASTSAAAAAATAAALVLVMAGDGVTNDAPRIQSAINTVAAAGGGEVHLSQGTFALASGIVIPPTVYVRGAGAGNNFATGSGVPWGTSPSFSTRLLWTGGFVSGHMVSFADGTFNAGISDLYIDGARSVANITAWKTDFDSAINSEPTLNGIHSTSNMRLIVERIGIQNVNNGILMDSAAGHVNGFGIWEGVQIMTCNRGVVQFGLSTAAIANQSFKDLAIIGYYNRGIDFIAWTDSNAYHNVYFATTITPSVAVWYNSGNPGIDNGVGYNNFTNVITDLNDNGPAGDNGMRSVVCGYTTPGYSYMTAFISGTTMKPSLLPEIRAGGLFVWAQATAPSYGVMEQTIWAGGGKVGNVAAAWNYLDQGACTFWNSNHWNLLYSTAAFVANFKPASKVVRVDWVIYWDPGSATGGVRLLNDGAGAPLGTAIVPGAAGVRESMQDVTEAFMRLAGGATPNYVTPNDFRIMLQTFGSGAVAPTIYKSFLRVITADFA